MSKFLETLKQRLADAQARHQETQKRFQAAQAEATAANQRFQAVNVEFQGVSQEMAGWAKAVEVETKKEAAEAQAATGVTVPNVISASVAALPLPEVVDNPQNAERVNKTELVRDVLRSHPNGLKPVEVWKLVQEQIPHRAYVYSVLGRLKDRDLVSVRRGKYVYRAALKAAEDEKGGQPDLPMLQ